MTQATVFDDAFIDIPWDERAAFMRQYLSSVGNMTSVAVGATLDEHSFEWLWVIFLSDGTKTYLEQRRFFYLPQSVKFQCVDPSDHLRGVHMFREAMTKRRPAFPRHWHCELPHSFIHCVLSFLDKLHAWSAISAPSRVDEHMGGLHVDLVAKLQDKEALSFSTFTGAVYADGTEGNVLIDKLLRFVQREPHAFRRSALVYQFMSLLFPYSGNTK